MFLYIETRSKPPQRYSINIKFRKPPDLYFQFYFLDSPTKKVIDYFKKQLMRKIRSCEETYNPTLYLYEYRVTKKRRVLRLIAWLLKIAQNVETDDLEQIETIRYLRNIQAELTSEISKNNNRPQVSNDGSSYVAPTKHKSTRSLQRVAKIKGDHSHRTYEATKQGKRGKKSYIVVREKFDSFIPEFKAFASQLVMYALGPEHCPKIRCNIDEKGFRDGVRSSKIDGLQTLETLVKHNSLPSQEKLIEAGLIEAMAMAYAFADYDLHPDNISLNAQGKIVVFDFDHLFYPKTCKYFDFKPNEEFSKKFVTYPAPIDSFPITARDLLSFPRLRDASPFWWPSSLNKQDPKQKNCLAPFLAGIENKPGVQYRAFKTFLRIMLMERSMVEKFAQTHIRTIKKRKEYVDFAMVRIAELKKVLLSLDEFKAFLSQKVFEEIIIDLKQYNASFSDNNVQFRVNIAAVEEKFKAEFRPGQDLRSIKATLYASLENVKCLGKNLQLSELQRKNIADIDVAIGRLTNTGAGQIIQQKIDSHATQFKQMLEEEAIRKNQKTVKSFLLLSNKIEQLHVFYSLVDEPELKSKIETLFKKVSDLTACLYSNEINNLDAADLAFKEFQNLEVETQDFVALTQRKNYSVSFFSQPNQDESEADRLISGIEKVLEIPHAKLRSQYPGQFFVSAHHNYYLNSLLEKCKQSIKSISRDMTSGSNPGYANELNLRILQIIAGYLHSNRHTIAFNGIMNIAEIIAFMHRKNDQPSMIADFKKYLSSVDRPARLRLHDDLIENIIRSEAQHASILSIN